MERTIFEVGIGIILFFLSWMEMMIFMDWLTILLFLAWPIASVTRVFDDYPRLKLVPKVMTVGIILWGIIGFVLFAFGFTGMDISVSRASRCLAWLIIVSFFAWPIVSITKVFENYPRLKLVSKLMTMSVVLWSVLGFIYLAGGSFWIYRIQRFFNQLF